VANVCRATAIFFIAEPGEEVTDPCEGLSVRANVHDEVSIGRDTRWFDAALPAMQVPHLPTNECPAAGYRRITFERSVPNVQFLLSQRLDVDNHMGEDEWRISPCVQHV
jgi:hypothetical protein